MAGIFQSKIFQIIVAVLIPFIGMLINFLLGSNRDMYPWYGQIKRPTWGPPDWVFGPVWTFLYASMGYASFRVWDEGDGFRGRARDSLVIYILQLILNWTWTITFFKLHLLGWATIHIVAILIVIIINAILFYRVDKFAGYLFVPYIAWVSFATVLTISIWRLNSSSSS